MIFRWTRRCRFICWRRFRCSIRNRPITRSICSRWWNRFWKIPDIILRKQLDRVKDQKMAEMKQAGHRIRRAHGGIGEARISQAESRIHLFDVQRLCRHGIRGSGRKTSGPKSIAREMFEQFRSFADYIKDYELQRAEGVLLRHLVERAQSADPNRSGRRQERRGARNGTLSCAR